MVSGLRKLSEIAGQEHITSVLRSMVIRDSVNRKICIDGGEDTAREIFNAFLMSLNCMHPVRGDACFECYNCRYVADPTTWGDFLLPWHRVQCYVEPEPVVTSQVIYTSFEPFDGFITFQVKEGVGTYINSDILSAFIFAYQSTKTDALSAARKLGKELTYQEYLKQYIDIVQTILYLRMNLEVKEVDKLDALRALSVRISNVQLTAVIRILWDAQSKTTLPDATSIEVVSLLISEALQPTLEPIRWENSSQTPIEVIDSNNLEQPLDLDKMLEIARI